MDKDVVSCGKGWSKLYLPIIHLVIAHDLVQTTPDKKIGIEYIKNSYGSLDVKFINENNLTTTIINKTRNVQERSKHTCEICGCEENIGITGSSLQKQTCCGKCYKEVVRKETPLVSWHKI